MRWSDSWAGLAGLFVATAAGAILGPPPCGDGSGAAKDELPIVLRVGLPADGALAALPRRELSRKVAELFRQVYGTSGLCRGQRRLQVNVALGDEYQIVDWLAQGRIDVGVTTDVGLYLLTRRDRQSLVELDLFQASQVVLQLPRLRQTLRSFTVSGGRVAARSAPRADFETFLAALWQGTASASEEGDSLCLPPRAGGGPAAALGYRLEVPSHLSTASFVALLGEANLWLARQPGASAPAAGSRSREERFWNLFLERTAFTFARAPAAPDPAREGIVLQSGEEISPSEGFRHHLVLPAQLAANLLEPGSVREVSFELPPGSEELLARCAPAAARSGEGGGATAASEVRQEDCRIPAPLRPWLEADPIFRVRSYGFTLEESLALLRRHQTTSGTSKLALVLPGGGVKAVYQSKLIDQLYERKLLRNALADGAGGALPVDAVIGTSGGALLGYFVARLSARGPFNLSKILWENKLGATLDSSDIFDWGDLLRYSSAVAIFFVFSLSLALFSFQTARFARGADGLSYPASRWRLALALWPPLLLAPLLVGMVNGPLTQEHVPASEGLFYLLCTTVAIFADQCFLVRPPEAKPSPAPLPLHPLVFLLPGIALAVLPLLPLGRASETESWSAQPLLFAGAFGPLLLMTVGLGFVLPAFRRRASSEPLRRRLLPALGELSAAVLLGALLLALPAPFWERLSRIPFFLVGFVLLFFLLWYGPSIRGKAESGRRLPLRGYYAAMAITTLLVALLCAPRDLAAAGCSYWLRESRLDLSLGAFLVCLGLLLFLVGVLLWVARSPDYRVEQAREFRSALGLSLFLVAAVNVVLFGLQGLGARFAGLPALRRFSFLELTGGFWLWLAGVSFAVSVAVIVAGALVAQRRPHHRLIRGLRFLCGSHPNGIFFDRRFVRVALLGLGALSWWNFVLAPALYGNGPAQRFLAHAVERFEQESARANLGARSQLRTQFLTPANVLERDGTRYFLILPPGAEECQPIFQPPGSGAVWNQFTIREPGTGAVASSSVCPQAVAWTPEEIKSVIFASGSPFPIFPAHWVAIPKEDGSHQTETVALVDGGYSNNEPVDAAVGIGAAQVLIVRSSSLGGGEHGGASGRPAAGDLLRRLHGPLVGDLSRLAGFLFERAQQQDRLSRREVFTVSLSPRPRAEWPALFDFRTEVVDRLRSCATQDLERRIGAVESWGPPRFQLSVEIPPTRL